MPFTAKSQAKRKMQRHTERQTLGNSGHLVKPVRKEMKQRDAADADAIGIVRPVNQQSAEHHGQQDRKVDPVKPARRELVFLLEDYH